jgi:hypothetical protein
MTVKDGAYIAALSKKLMEAERALHGFRVIFNHFNDTRTGSEGLCSVAEESSGQSSDGSYLREPECVE